MSSFHVSTLYRNILQLSYKMKRGGIFWCGDGGVLHLDNSLPTLHVVIPHIFSKSYFTKKKIPHFSHTFHDIWCILTNALGIFFFPFQEVNTGVARLHSRCLRKTSFPCFTHYQVFCSSSCFFVCFESHCRCFESVIKCGCCLWWLV